MENISFEISDLINSFFGYWSGWHDSWNMLLMKRDGVNYINLFRSFITLYEFLSNEFNRIGVWILHCWRQFSVENFSNTFYFHENWEKSMKGSKGKFIVTFSFKNCRIFQVFLWFFLELFFANNDLWWKIIVNGFLGHLDVGGDMKILENLSNISNRLKMVYWGKTHSNFHKFATHQVQLIIPKRTLQSSKSTCRSLPKSILKKNTKNSFYFNSVWCSFRFVKVKQKSISISIFNSNRNSSFIFYSRKFFDAFFSAIFFSLLQIFLFSALFIINSIPKWIQFPSLLE